MRNFLVYFIYWLLQCTWGIIMTAIGAIAALGCLIAGHKPKQLGPTIYFEFGKNWGGINLGPFCFINTMDNDIERKRVYAHEFGHSIQNIMFGPFFLPLISIPSMVRCVLRDQKGHFQKLVFAFLFLILSSILFTVFAWLMTFTHIKFLVITMEIFRIYFILLSLWMGMIEIPRYVNPCKPTEEIFVAYDAIWFEEQATAIGEKILEKKEG